MNRQGPRLPKSSSKSENIILAVGLAIFAGGALSALAFPGHTLSVTLRLLGLLILAYSGVRSRRSLTFWIFFAMLAGFEIGIDKPQLATNMKVLGDIFLRLIKVIVAPLILGTLVTGIAAHGDLKKIGRIGLKSLIFFEVVTTIALVLGIAAINLTKAGVGMVLPAAAEQGNAPTAPLKWDDFLLHVFPENIAKAVADNQILQVAVFAILFGIALTLVSEKKRQPMLELAESLAQTMFKFTNIVMYYAPIGVGAAMAYTVGHMGIGVLLPLAKLVLTAYGALLAFLLFVLLPIAFFAGIPVLPFTKSVAEPATIAFATSTSEAALPRAMEAMEKFGVPEDIVAFVIPAGYSFNLTGSTLYLALASIFIAQTAGMHLSLAEQVFMVFMLMLTSKGIAGVPRAVTVVLLATASTFHLPTEPIFVILGVDALIDMARTSVNVIGNCLASAVIARSEGTLNIPAAPDSPAASLP
jgi:proton glutamate symport protein